MAKDEIVRISKKDLLAAWAIVEEITVSFDQIGGAFGIVKGDPNGEETHQAMLEALGAYIRPRVVHALNDARMRLGQYIPDAEAEHLSEHKIPYWNYAGLKALRKRSSASQRKPANGKKTKAMG